MAIPFKENIEMNATPDPTNNKHVITYGTLKSACENTDGGIHIDSSAKVWVQARYLFPWGGGNQKEFAPYYAPYAHNNAYTYTVNEDSETASPYFVLDAAIAKSWNSLKSYTAGDIVAYNGGLYKCIKASGVSTNSEPWYYAIVDGTKTAVYRDTEWELINIMDIISSIGSGSGSSYTLPVANSSTLGGIKVGSGLFIDENGVLSTSYTLPTASEQTKGGIKVGSGLTIDANDILSVSIFSASTSVSSSNNTATVQLSSGTSIYKTTVNANTSFEFTAPTGYSGGTLTFELVIAASADATLTWPTDNGVDLVKWLGTPDSSTGIATGSNSGLTAVKSGYTYYLVFRTNDGTHFIGNIQGVIATDDAQ